MDLKFKPNMKYHPNYSKNKPNFLALKITSAVIITLSFFAILFSFNKNNSANSTKAISKKARIVSSQTLHKKKTRKKRKKAKNTVDNSFLNYLKGRPVKACL